MVKYIKDNAIKIALNKEKTDLVKEAEGLTGEIAIELRFEWWMRDVCLIKRNSMFICLQD